MAISTSRILSHEVSDIEFQRIINGSRNLIFTLFLPGHNIQVSAVLLILAKKLSYLLNYKGNLVFEKLVISFPHNETRDDFYTFGYVVNLISSVFKMKNVKINNFDINFRKLNTEIMNDHMVKLIYDLAKIICISNVKNLKIYGDFFTDEIIRNMFAHLESNTSMESIMVSGNKSVGSDSHRNLTSFCSNHPNVKKIILSISGIDVGTMEFHIGMLKQTGMKELNLTNIVMKGLVVNVLFKSLANNTLMINNLHMESVRLNVKSLAEILKTNVHIEKITIKYVLSTSKEENPYGYFFEVMETQKYIVQIDILLQNSHCDHEKAAKGLSNVIKNNNTIAYLIFMHTEFATEDIRIICGSLKDNNTIKMTSFQNCHIDKTGAFYFSEVLKVNRSLQYLYLGDNNLGNDGVKFLVDGLSENNTLCILNIDQTNFTDEGLVSLTQYANTEKNTVVQFGKTFLNSSIFNQFDRALIITYIRIFLENFTTKKVPDKFIQAYRVLIRFIQFVGRDVVGMYNFSNTLSTALKFKDGEACTVVLAILYNYVKVPGLIFWHSKYHSSIIMSECGFTDVIFSTLLCNSKRNKELGTTVKKIPDPLFKHIFGFLTY